MIILIYRESSQLHLKYFPIIIFIQFYIIFLIIFFWDNLSFPPICNILPDSPILLPDLLFVVPSEEETRSLSILSVLYDFKHRVYRGVSLLYYISKMVYMSFAKLVLQFQQHMDLLPIGSTRLNRTSSIWTNSRRQLRALPTKQHPVLASVWSIPLFRFPFSINFSFVQPPPSKQLNNPVSVPSR